MIRWVNLFIFKSFLKDINIYLCMYFREREREGGREGEQENETERERFSFGVPLIDAFVCIHLLTRTCPDLRSNPQPCSLDDVLTY